MIKIVRPKPRPRSSGTSKIELALAKPIGVSKKFCFSDVPREGSWPGDEGSWRMHYPSAEICKSW
jgi:hypothetical protein